MIVFVVHKMLAYKLPLNMSPFQDWQILRKQATAELQCAKEHRGGSNVIIISSRLNARWRHRAIKHGKGERERLSPAKMRKVIKKRGSRRRLVLKGNSDSHWVFHIVIDLV